MALLSFVDSTPRAYRLKAGNAARRISTDAGTSPSLFPVSQTAKSRQMSVGHPSIGERIGESIDVELRIRPRARDRPHVDEHIHGHLPEQSQKFGDRTRRMTYREDSG
jgi:hypothetical protein